MNLDDILDQSIDDLKDLPEFKVPPTGIYEQDVSLVMKEINKKPAIVAHHVIIECKSLADDSIPENERAKPGDSFDVGFILKDESGQRNEVAEGFFKAFMIPFHAHFDDKSIKSVVEKMKDPVRIVSAIEKKERKGDKEKFDAKVSDIVIS